MSIQSKEAQTPPTQDMIPLCVPEIRGNEWAYVKECLDTGWVSSVGSYVTRFETDLANYVGAKYAIACVNGTSALHISLLVAGVEPGDEVLISDITFVAPANAIRYAGAHPVFIDVSADTWQIDPQKVTDFLDNACEVRDGELYNIETGRRVKAIVPVHVLGHPVDIDPILAAARKYNIPVIEDATESLGAKYKDRSVGTLGDIACFSFNGNKLITTGGGGMITTDNEVWASKAKYLTTQAKDDPVEYIHSEIGYNYRLTNVQAALGCAQLELVDEYIEKKLAIAKRYNDALSQVEGVTTMPHADWASSVHWLYTILIDDSVTGTTSRETMAYLKDKGIQTRPLWQPMHMSPVSKDDISYQIENSPRLYLQCLSLPCSVGLQRIQQTRVIETIHKFFRK